MSKATLNQGQEILKLFGQSGIDRESLQDLLQSGELTEFLQAFKDRNQAGVITYKVKVDYLRPIDDMIEAGGYSAVTEHVTRGDFSIAAPAESPLGVQEVEFHVVCFGCRMTIKEVRVELDKQGLRPANLLELCAFGAAQPAVRIKCSIVAVGSEYHADGRACHPHLEASGHGSFYRLHAWCSPPDSPWMAKYRFLAVPK